MGEGQRLSPHVFSTGRRGPEPRTIITGTAIASLLLLVAYPLFLLLLHSFEVNGKPTIASYLKTLTERQNLIALANSLYVSLAVTLLAVLIGVGMAWLVTRTDLPFRRVVRGLIFFTFIIPPYIGVIGWIQLFGRAGYVNVALMRAFDLPAPPIELYSLEGIIAVMAIYLYPLIFWATANALERTDPTLEDAAASSGGTRWRVLTTITLPLALPSILSAAILVFIHMISCFCRRRRPGAPHEALRAGDEDLRRALPLRCPDGLCPLHGPFVLFRRGLPPPKGPP